MIYAQFFKPFGFLCYSGYEFNSLIFRMQYHSRMRKKSKDDSFTLLLTGNFLQTADDFLMPEMDPVERANCNHRVFDLQKFIDVVINLHDYKEEAKLTFSMII